MGAGVDPRDQRLAGIGSALLAAVLWGLSGTAAQYLFQGFSFPPAGMVAIRMPIAGSVLYLVFRPKLPRAKLTALIFFSVVGLWAAQYTYLLAIDLSNAATGTLLQYLFLPMVAAYEMLAAKTRAAPATVVPVALATLGTLELVAGTGSGSLGLLVTPAAVVVGLMSACAVAVFMLASGPLIREYGPPAVTTWGMLIGSLVAVPAGSYSVVSYVEGPSGGGLEVVGLVLFVALVGTALPFFLYFRGLERVAPTEAGVVSSAEPITAALASFLFLHVVLTGFQYLGGALIVVAVAVIALGLRRPRREEERRSQTLKEAGRPGLPGTLAILSVLREGHRGRHRLLPALRKQPARRLPARTGSAVGAHPTGGSADP